MKKIKTQLMILAMMGIMAGGLAGCDSSGGVIIDDPIFDTWYNVFGEPCGDLREGCAWVDDVSDLKADWWDDSSTPQRSGQND